MVMSAGVWSVITVIWVEGGEGASCHGVHENRSSIEVDGVGLGANIIEDIRRLWAYEGMTRHDYPSPQLRDADATP